MPKIMKEKGKRRERLCVAEKRSVPPALHRDTHIGAAR